MHARRRSSQFASVVAIRLTDEQAAAVLERARRTGQTSSEWGRQALLQALEIDSDTRLLLAEMLAVRKIFLKLHIDVLEGRKLTESQVKEVIETVEIKKFFVADEHIRQFRKQQYESQQ